MRGGSTPFTSAGARLTSITFLRGNVQKNVKWQRNPLATAMLVYNAMSPIVRTKQ
jgi:hypothetical protein